MTGKEDSFTQLLRRVSRSQFPRGLTEFGIAYCRNLLAGIVAFRDRNVRSKANILKFCNDLRVTQEVWAFAPMTINYYGFYDPKLGDILSELEVVGILGREQSLLDDFPYDVYYVDKYREQIPSYDGFERRYDDWKKNVNLYAPFDQHDRKKVYPIAENRENYLGVDADEFETYRRDSDLRDDRVWQALADDPRNRPAFGRRLSDEEETIAAVLQRVLEEFKRPIPDDATRQEEQARDRKLHVDEAVWGLKWLPEEVSGELGVWTGFFDGREELIPSKDSAPYYLKEDVADGATAIPVHFDGEFYVPNLDFYNHMVLVFGYLSADAEPPGVQAVSIHDLGSLPEPVVEYQEESRSRQVELSNLEREMSVDRIERALNLAIDSGTLDSDEESEAKSAIEYIRNGIDDVQRVRDVTNLLDEYPLAKQILFETMSSVSGF